MNASTDGGTPTMSKITPHNHAQRPWWHELLLVDFRHAFWPWVAYLAACGVYASVPPSGDFKSRWIGTLVIIIFAVPAVIVQTYSTDYSHHTSQSLLTFPRQRNTIWLSRTILLVILLAFPLIIATGVFQVQEHASKLPSQLVRSYLTFILETMYCQITIGALLSVLLRKKLVAWSAIVVSPIILIPLAQTLAIALDFDAVFTPNFPYLPAFQFWSIIIIGIPAIILAYRQWLRLEVRS